MRRTTSTLLLAGIVAFPATALLVYLHLLAWNHFVYQQLNQNSATRYITMVILFVTLLLIFFVLERCVEIRHQLKIVGQVRRLVANRNVPSSLSEIDSYLNGRLPDQRYSKSLIRHRFELLKEGTPPVQGDLAAFVASNQSGLDSANSEASYNPVRALVWALPALGFLGTASAMSRAVTGLGGTVARTNSYTDLRSFLVQDVIPPLASAFGVTLIALASAVVCHLLVTVAHTYEQRLLLDADSVTLAALAACSPATDTGSGVAPGARNIKALTAQIEQLNKSLEQLNQSLSESGLDRLALLLQDIREGLGRDLIVKRS